MSSNASLNIVVCCYGASLTCARKGGEIPKAVSVVSEVCRRDSPYSGISGSNCKNVLMELLAFARDVAVHD